MTNEILNNTQDKCEEYNLAHLGKRLKMFRTLAGMSQKNVATILDITSQQYQKYETGQNRIPLQNLHKLVRHYKLDSYDDLINLDRLPKYDDLINLDKLPKK